MFIPYALWKTDENESRMEAATPLGKLMEQLWEEDARMDSSEKLDEGKWSGLRFISEEVATGLGGLGVKKGSPGRLLASDFSNEMVEPLQEEKARGEKYS